MSTTQAPALAPAPSASSDPPPDAPGGTTDDTDTDDTDDHADDDGARLAAAAARIATAGRAAWPTIALADHAVAAHLRARQRRAPDARLDDLRDADLYLAFALADALPAALAVFERELVPHIDAALRRLRLPGGAADEVRQAMRVDLLADARAITAYAGRGELTAWLRVIATRRALRLTRRGDRQQELDEMLLDRWPGATPDPAATHLRATCAEQLGRAVRAAFFALEVRQRNLLRQHFLDELTIDDLARLYRVHRATCARWLAQARLDLGRRARKHLVGALGSAADVDSVLRLLDGDVELSLARLLASR